MPIRMCARFAGIAAAVVVLGSTIVPASAATTITPGSVGSLTRQGVATFPRSYVDPVAAAGSVYVFFSPGDPTTERLTKVSPDLSTRAWTADAPCGNLIGATEQIVLVLTSCTQSDPQVLVAMDAATGSSVWHRDVHGTLAGSVLYAVDTPVPGSGDPSTELSAIDADTGQSIWQSTDGRGYSAPVIDNGLLYDTAGTTLEARDPGTGDIVWSRDWTTRTALTVDGAGDGLVFLTAWKGAVPGPHAMLAVEQSTHRVRWTHRSLRSVFTVQGGQVLAGDSTDEVHSGGQRLVSLDVGSGALVWSRTAVLRAVSDGGVGFVDASYPREGIRALDLSDDVVLRGWRHDEYASVAGGSFYTVNRNDRVRRYV
jgi:hypothetical protein